MHSRKIVLVGPFPPPVYGQSISFKMLAEGLNERNLEYSIVNISPKKTLPGIGFSIFRALEYIKILLDFFYKTVGSKRAIYITIAQSRTGFLRDFVMIWWSFLFRHKIIAHLKGGNFDGFYKAQSNLMKFLIRQTLLRCSKLLVLGEALIQMYDFEPRLHERIHVVPNGLPFKQSDQTKKLVGIEENLKIIFLSNLIEKKGYLDVLDVLKVAKDRGVKFSCDFCGEFIISPDDELVESVEQAKSLFAKKVRDLDLEGNIQYLGPLYGDKKEQKLREADLFILPTAYINEGQPVSIIEAMAFSLVVISTPFRAIPELVEEGVSGYLCKYGDTEEMASRIIDLYNDREKLRTMSHNAKERYKKLFTREKHLEQIIPFIIN